MKNLKFIVVAVVAVGASGCATYQSLENDPTYACMAKVEAMPELASLKVKLGSLRGASQDLDVIADKSTPTAEIKPLIKQWHESRLACIDAGETFRATKAVPGYAALVSSHTSSYSRLIARLYQGEVSYSEFAAQRAELYEAMNKNVARVFQEFDMNEREANRQAAMTYLMLQSAMPRPAAPAPAYVPVQPIPTYVPPRTINCTSYNYGLSTQTTCR